MYNEKWVFNAIFINIAVMNADYWSNVICLK